MSTLLELNNKYNFISQEKDKVHILDQREQKINYSIQSDTLIITKILNINFTELQVKYLFKNYISVIKLVYSKCSKDNYFMYYCFLFNVRTLLVN